MIGAILLGLPIVIHAVKGILHGHMHMDELVALAVIAAFAIASMLKPGRWPLLCLLPITRNANGPRGTSLD
jgi:cation transport ATPase